MIDETSNIVDILIELDIAKKKHPEFPDDLIHKVAVMVEEAGEAMRAALIHVYEGGDIEDVKLELKQTGAMCLRCLETIE